MTPRIVCPVSRHLSVADVERSIAFQRDVLGFEARSLPHGDGLPAVAEVVSGLRDFTVLDLEGNRLTFAQTFE